MNWTCNDLSNIELSIVFPVYKVAAYLPKCIESVSQWDADYVEYLFVDDGSPDNCAEIISGYAQKDPRIHLLKKKMEAVHPPASLDWNMQKEDI